MSLLHKEITEKIIKAFYEVYNELGYGFLESVYESALCIVLQKQGLLAEPQREIDVKFRSQVIGKYKADVVIERKVIVEIKAVRRVVPRHEAQLLNFGPDPKFKRLVFTNDLKVPKPVDVEALRRSE